MKASRVHKKVSKNKIQHFDKYDYYRRAVQSPDSDVEFIWKTYKQTHKKDPQIFREDFCGTSLLSCEWVKLNKKNKSIGVDLDPEPMEYGKTNYISQLTASQQSRIQLLESNVLSPKLPFADVICAFNFSYFIFKERKTMLEYFKNVKSKLNANGMFFLDIFGGSECFEPNEDETKYKKFIYYWDQATFNPINNHSIFHIHFKPKGEKKFEKVFTYDWRFWSISEIRDLLAEAGFQKTHVYWEGTNRLGGGNGIFTKTEKVENCLSWISYITAEV